jgi:hypothetical protein
MKENARSKVSKGAKAQESLEDEGVVWRGEVLALLLILEVN